MVKLVNGEGWSRLGKERQRNDWGEGGVWANETERRDGFGGGAEGLPQCGHAHTHTPCSACCPASILWAGAIKHPGCSPLLYPPASMPDLSSLRPHPQCIHPAPHTHIPSPRPECQCLSYSRMCLHPDGSLVVWPGILFLNSRGYQSYGKNLPWRVLVNLLRSTGWAAGWLRMQGQVRGRWPWLVCLWLQGYQYYASPETLNQCVSLFLKHVNMLHLDRAQYITFHKAYKGGSFYPTLL